MTGIGVRPAVAVGIAAAALAACGSEAAGDLGALRSPPMGSGTFGVFEGKTPCSDCERIKVRLTLFARPDRGTPTGYLLERIYVGKGDERTVDEGGWQTTTGSPTDADAVVVILNPTAPQEFRRFQRVGDNILLMLDDRCLPRVGDAQHNFTLSRTA